MLTLESFVDIKAVNTCPLTVKVELTTKFPVITTLPSVVVFPTICSLLSEVGLSIPIPTLPVFTIFIIRWLPALKVILLLSNIPVPFTLSNSMRLSVFIHWILYLDEEFHVPVSNILPLFNVNNCVGLVVPIPTLPPCILMSVVQAVVFPAWVLKSIYDLFQAVLPAVVQPDLINDDGVEILALPPAPLATNIIPASFLLDGRDIDDITTSASTISTFVVSIVPPELCVCKICSFLRGFVVPMPTFPVFLLSILLPDLFHTSLLINKSFVLFILILKILLMAFM